MTFPALFLLFFAFAGAPDEAPQAKPAKATAARTKLSTATCKLIEQSDDPPGYWTRHRCPGVGGLSLELAMDDLRDDVSVVGPRGKATSLDLGMITPAFRTVGPHAEWRLQAGRPTALIIPVEWEHPPIDGTSAPEKHRAYAIARLDARCLVATVPADAPRALTEARKLADAAGGATCMRR